MARTSKTRMTDSGPAGDRMVRASAQGQSSVDRARSELNAQARFGVEQGQRRSEQIGGLMSQHAGREQQGEQFGQQMDLQQDRLDLEGAKAGFERDGGGRAAQLEQEMARGAEQTGVGQLDPESQERLRDQAGQGLEHEGGKWRSTQERRDQLASESKRKDFQADTDRIKAETYRDQVGQSYQKAQASGQKEEAKQLAATLSRPVNGDVDKFDRFMKSEQTEGDWSDLAKYAGESHELDPSLQADIKAQNFTPRVQQFLRSHISREGLKFVVRTGNTSEINVDWTAPQMRAFTEQVSQFNALAKSMGPEFSNFAGINSIEDKMAFLNTQAAMAVLMGMDQQQSADPTGGMTPSLGGPPPEGGAGEPPMDPNALGAQDPTGTSDPYASDEATQGAISDRANKRPVLPADSPFFNRVHGRERGGGRSMLPGMGVVNPK